MAPGGKAAEDVGLEVEDQQAGKQGPAADQGQGGEVAGAEVGDHQEGGEEDEGGAEVAHQRQTSRHTPVSTMNSPRLRLWNSRSRVAEPAKM